MRNGVTPAGYERFSPVLDVLLAQEGEERVAGNRIVIGFRNIQ